jgi:Mor family transcriptional regulator
MLQVMSDPSIDSSNALPKGSAVDLSDVVGQEICEAILRSFRGQTFYIPKTNTAQSEAVSAAIGRAAVDALRDAKIRRVKATVREGKVVGWSNRTYRLSQKADRLIRDAAIYERYVSGDSTIKDLMALSSLTRVGLYAALKRQRQRLIDGDPDE